MKDEGINQAQKVFAGLKCANMEQIVFGQMIFGADGSGLNAVERRVEAGIDDGDFFGRDVLEVNEIGLSSARVGEEVGGGSRRVARGEVEVQALDERVRGGKVFVAEVVNGDDRWERVIER